MLRSPSRPPKSFNQIAAEQIWPDETIVVLPETPRVRLSPRRKMHPQTPGWPPAHVGDTIRMYHDPEEEEGEEQTVNFTMNPEFIEKMQSFIPPVSPTKVRMLSPSRTDFEDDVIEIPDSAGLSDETRDAIFNVWVNDDLDEDSGYVEGMHHLRECQATQYKQRNAKLNLTIRYLVKQLQEKEKEIQRIPALEKKLINLQTQLKSLALIPMTPMRTSSLKHNLENPTQQQQQLPIPPRTPRSLHSKENFPRSRSTSPRKPLQQLQFQPSDLVREDTEEFLESSKRLFNTLHQENASLKMKIHSMERNTKLIDTLQSELETQIQENHRLENLLQQSRAENHHLEKSPIATRMGISSHSEREIERLSEELEWHAKLHLFAEKERLRLLDLLEFAGREGQIVGREYVGLKHKMSMISLRTQESDCKCLV